MKFKPDAVARALRDSWSIDTAKQWTEQNPAAGQCNVTALLVHGIFGGELLKTRLSEGDHFYNRINGVRYDFTNGQFGQPIHYADVPATPEEALCGVAASEATALREAFERNFSSSE